MQQFSSIYDMQTCSRHWKSAGRSIGFVPTMGNLHEGHLALVRKSQTLCDKTVVSIFVNPLQFGPGEDLDSYPRTLEDDLTKLANLNVDTIFFPSEQVMYPKGTSLTYVEVSGLSEILEGEFRPGFFRGVATVVNKLFNIVMPDSAVFGEKDFQQLRVIQKMVEDLNQPVGIIGEPTQREADGLAMSSRNNYLNPEQRSQAALLYQTLQEMRAQLLEGKVLLPEVEKQALKTLEKRGFNPEYVAIRDDQTLKTPQQTTKCVILAAAWLGTTRLIDNLRI